MDPLLEELTRRELSERSMTHEDAVIQRAMSLLGQPVNPVQVVSQSDVEAIYREAAPERVKNRQDEIRLWGVGGFRRPNDEEDPNIYINKNHELYRRAKDKGDNLGNLLMAATLAHEQTHNTEHGNEGERAARRIESDFLRSRIDTLPSHDRREALERLRMLDLMAANNPRNVK